MANKDDYLTYYREFFENFAQTVNPNDQLPVKLASYKLVNIEVVGGIIDWTTQYLTQKKCPPNLIAPLIKIVIEEIRKACKKHPLLCGFNPSDNAYEPLKLMQTVMAKTNEVCLRYLDNSMLCSLPSPGTPYFPTSVCAVKNSRRRMEDRHVVIHDLNTMFNIQEASPSSYYAVFDGHAGHDAAAYSSAHLHQFLAENRYFISNPEQALLDAFCKTDALFIDKCRVENLSSGTTAVVALLRPKEKSLYIAWVGDSQALLVNKGRLLQIVNPHKPSRKDERERIEKQGGCVLLWGTWRVNGQLAVSRAIGDVEYKPHVIAVPDIREIPLDGGEDFLILACDGLWDFVSEDCAARTVYNLVTENPDDIDRISQHLVQLSREQGSCDNISVIVVFLREPSKIAAEAHWANRNCTTATMDASLDNANNPFAISNGAATDNIISQKTDGLLLNLTDNFKQNGTDISPTADFYTKEKSNGKRSASEFDDDDFGPETDVDAVDDALSPVETSAKGFGDVFSNNNPAEGVYNPFMEHQEKAALEIERELQKQQSAEFEEQRLAREETPTPPADAVHDVSGLVDNVAESESEDEWNYFKGDEANKENISPQPDKEVAQVPEEDDMLNPDAAEFVPVSPTQSTPTPACRTLLNSQVAEVPEEDDNMSQLNPNAAEFVPVSPTRSIPSPACRTLLNDQVISQSPRRPSANDIDINVPNPVDFEKEVKSRPSDIDSYSNGHDDSSPTRTSTDLMETLLNGKNIDEIPEFQPGSTPSKVVPSEEFHFGPNAAPFTPAKVLDQSEAGLSTKAVYGDESTATLGTSFNESVASQDTAADVNLLNKESDPMSMSFYADKEDENPFDLNEVHVLPDNIDEFLKKPDTTFNETISDLPEHHPLGEPKDTTEDIILDNDDAIQITDLDKGAYYEEKELASPLEPEKELSEPERELLGGVEECDFSKTPEPTHENLLLDKEFCHIPEKVKTPEILPRDVELISPELKEGRVESASPRPESSHEDILESKSPLPEATEVADLLQSQPESLPHDVELLSPDLVSSRPESTHEEHSKSPLPFEFKSPLPEASEVDDLIQSKSPLLQATEIDDLLQAGSNISSKSPLPEMISPEPEVCQPPQSKTPASDIPEANSPIPGIESPVCDRPQSKSPVCELPISQSPLCELEVATSPICERPVSKSPVCELEVAKSPIPVLEAAKSPIPELDAAKSPIPELGVTESPVCELGTAKSPVSEPEVAKSPISEPEVAKSPISEPEVAKSPISEPEVATYPVGEHEDAKFPISEPEDVSSPVCEIENAKSPVCELEISKSPICELESSKSPVCEFEIPKSPVCEFEASKSPVCEFAGAKSPVFELEGTKSPTGLDIESKYLISQSTVPFEIDHIVEADIRKADLHFEQLCKSNKDLQPTQIEFPTQAEFTSPEILEKAQNYFEKVFKPKEAVSPVESPQEDVTSSLKDDLASSPAKSPVPEQVIDESFVDIQETADAVQEPAIEAAPVILDACPVPASKPDDTESVATTDMNSFLERSLPPDVASPLSPVKQDLDFTPKQVDEAGDRLAEPSIPQSLDLDLNQSLLKCEQIDIKTENITPEYAEQAIVTPSEESKQEDVPTAPLVEEPVKEPVVEEEKKTEPAVAAAGVAVATAVAAGAVAAVAAAAKPEEKKKASASPAKKPAAAKTTTSKPATLKASTTPKPTSRLSASPKTSPAKTGTARPATTATAPKPAATKPSPRPRPTTAPKSTEKKPLANGDVKSTVRSTLATKKTVTETTTKSATTARTSTGAATKLSPTKTTTSRLTASRPATAPTPKTTATRTPTSTASATAKPRPISLSHRTTTTSTAKPATMTKSPPPKTSPKTTTAPRPRPPTTTTLSKPRVPLTKTVSKAADTEKQNKESANKLTASRTVTSTTRTATGTARTTTSSVRKIESKTGTTRTTKTTMTTMKSTTAKKPSEIVRHATSKTKTTKVEKPKENGVSTVVTEEITVVTNTSAVIDSEPQLIKDNSPVDNKLIIENTFIQTNTAD